jgi:trehalose 6-phosphate phosphatase
MPRLDIADPAHKAQAVAATGRAITAVLDRAVIAVDFDGTLAPITAHPKDSRAAPGAVEALTALAAAGASVAIITGRSAMSALEAGGFADIPDLVIAGNYGAELWHNHHLESPPPPPAINRLSQELPHLIQQLVRDPSIWVEDKGLSLVVHARQTSDPQAALDALHDPLAAVASTMELEVHPGKDVLEVRQAGIDKATALTRLLRDTTSALVYIGDDVGDIPAFRASHHWRSCAQRPALTVAVVSGPGSPVAGIADLELTGPPAVVALLADLAPGGVEPR